MGMFPISTIHPTLREHGISSHAKQHWGDEPMLKVIGTCCQRVLVSVYSICAFRCIYLVDDVDAVVDLLPPEDRVEVVEPVLKVVFSVTERDDDGHLNNSESFTWRSIQTHN